MSIDQGKLYQNIIQDTQVFKIAYLGWSIKKYVAKNCQMSQYLFIFLSFYRNIVRKNVSFDVGLVEAKNDIRSKSNTLVPCFL